MSFITVAAGQPIRATHVNQFTQWITGGKKDVSLSLTTTSATDYSAVITNEDTTAGLIAKFAYGASAANTVMLINKTGVTISGNLNSTNPLAGVFTTTGDTVYSSGGSTSARLPIGSTYQTLQVSTGGIPAWGSSPTSVLTAQGDTLYAQTANSLQRLTKGTAFQEYVMNAGATAPTWASGVLAAVQTSGDIVYGNGANTVARLAKGADGTFLTLSGGVPAWGTPGAAAQSVQSPILNGDFTVWQRGTSFASIAHLFYSADGWQYQKVLGTGVHDVTRSTDVPAVATTVPLQAYSALLSVKTTEAAIGATEVCHFTQPIEGLTFLPFAQRPFTLSFWVKATKTGTYCVAFRNSGNDRSYVSEYTVSSSATWEQKTVSVSASPSAGTWSYTAGAVGLLVTFTLAGGTNVQATAATLNTWTSANMFSSANQVNSLDTTANTFQLSSVQIDLGTSASQFAPLPHPLGIERCLRYCRVFTSGSSFIATLVAGTANQLAAGTYALSPPMMTAPSVNTALFTSGWTIQNSAATSPTFGAATPDSFSLSVNSSTAGYTFFQNSSSTIILTAAL